MTIKELQKECFAQAVKSGWEDKKPPVPEMVALICSEACEALEEYRNSKPLMYQGEGGKKPEGLAAEFADIVIRVAHYAGSLGFDLESAIEVKMEYNRTRPYRHGGKKC